MPPSIQSLTATNWGPFPEIRIKPGRLTAVMGPNGAGKSALAQAIRWGVCGGKIPMAPDENGLINDAGSQCSVGITWDDGLEAIRTRKRGGPTRLAVGGAGGRAAQEEIRARIGLDEAAYVRLAQVDQGEVTKLAGATDQQRRDTLLSWMGEALERWDTGRLGLLRERLETGRERIRLRARIESVSETLDSLSGDDIDFSRDLVDRILQIDKRIGVLRDRIRASIIAETSAQNLRTELARLLQARAAVVVPAPFVEDEPPRPDTSKRTALTGRLGTIRSKRSELLAVLGADSSGTVCPLVGARCQAASWVASERVAVEERSHRLDSEAGPITAEIEQIKKDGRRYTSWVAARGRTNQVAARVADQMNRLDSDLVRVQEDIEQIPENPDDRSRLESELDELSRQRALLVSEQETAKRIRQAQDVLAGTKTVLEQVSREYAVQTDLIKLIDRTAGPKALAGARVESLTNEMLEGTGMVLRLEWDRVTGQRVTVCQSCGESCQTNRKTCPGCKSERDLSTKPDLRILVMSSGIERDLRYLSGGRKQIVCLALRLATCPTPWIVLDEVDSSMDERMRALAAQICRAAATRLQIIVITHHPEIAEQADRVFTVEQSGGVSEVKS